MPEPDWEKINKRKAEREAIKHKQVQVGMSFKIAARECAGKNLDLDDLANQIIEKTKFYYGAAVEAEKQILDSASASAPTNKSDDNHCSECGRGISANVSEFSKNKYDKPLCMEHQK